MPNDQLKARAKQLKFRRGFKSWAETTSVNHRLALGLRPTYHLPSRTLAAHLRIPIYTPGEIKGLSTAQIALLNGTSDWSAVTIKISENFIIIHNEGHTAARQESNIMHELAHIICKHPMSKIQHTANDIVLREYNEAHEAEAEWLGGCLQLPRVALFYAKKEYGLDIPKIAEKFNASEQMVKYRIGVTGLSR